MSLTFIFHYEDHHDSLLVPLCNWVGSANKPSLNFILMNNRREGLEIPSQGNGFVILNISEPWEKRSTEPTKGGLWGDSLCRTLGSQSWRHDCPEILGTGCFLLPVEG